MLSEANDVASAIDALIKAVQRHALSQRAHEAVLADLGPKLEKLLGKEERLTGTASDISLAFLVALLSDPATASWLSERVLLSAVLVSRGSRRHALLRRTMPYSSAFGLPYE